MHRYGAHLFHTSNPTVWEYVNRFTTFTNYVHRVYTTHKGDVFPLPINLGTINQFFRAAYTPAEARALVHEHAGEFDVKGAANLEEKGIALDRTTAVRGIHPRLHREAVADRSDGAAGRGHQPAARPLHI